MDLSNNFTKIPNMLLEAIMSSQLTAQELTVLLAVIRMTYGYHKKSETLPLGRLSAMVGRSPSQISKAVSSLSQSI